VEVEASR